MEKIQNEPLNPCEEVLAHHGILGMKWGVRRYQNKDGSLTALGRKRYGYNNERVSELKSEISDLKKRIKLYNDNKDSLKKQWKGVDGFDEVLKSELQRKTKKLSEINSEIKEFDKLLEQDRAKQNTKALKKQNLKEKAKTYKDKINNYVNYINQQALETHLRDVRTHEEMTRQANQQALEDHLRAVNAHEEMVRQVNQQNQVIQMQQMMMPPMFF